MTSRSDIASPVAARGGIDPSKAVTIVGGGLMGRGIALAVLKAGLDVALIEQDAGARAKAFDAIDASFQRDVAKGRLTPDDARERLARIAVHADLSEGRDADLFIEAVFEDMAVKRDVFAALDRVAAPGAVLASNTSTLDLNVIAGFTRRPESVIGLHFFSPANVMRLLEVVRADRTSPETLDRALAFARAIGKVAVVAGVCDGFIGNRLFEEYLRQTYLLLEDGALPQQVDAALEAFGMAMGPCRTMDLAGQDIGWNIRKRRAVEQPGRPYSTIPDLICERGRFGQKAGAGFYRYPDGRSPVVDPEIEALIASESARLGIVRRAIGDEEIVSRTVLAIVNEGARVVAEGIAARPADVDTVYREGYGFPASRGGPMAYADRLGLPAVLATIERYAAQREGWAWAPAPLIEDLVHRGAGFGTMN